MDRAGTNPSDGTLTAGSILSREDLGTLGGASSYAADVNNADVVVGWSETPTGAIRAFRWSRAEGMVDLGTLAGDPMSKAVAVLDGATGDILGMSGEEGRWTPVVWSRSGAIRALAVPFSPNSTTSLPTAFNARGDVVGSDVGAFQHGWVWSEGGGKYDLSANVQGGSSEGSAVGVTASGLVALTTRASTCQRTTSCWRTYLWTLTSGYQSLGTIANDGEGDIAGLGLNELGVVVGWAAWSGTAAAPYVWAAGEGFRLLANYATGGSAYGYAAAINSSGTVVGADFEPATGSIVASAWTANGAIVRLSPDDPNPSIAVAVNDPGTIAGWAAISDGVNHAVIWRQSSQLAPVGVRSLPLSPQLTAVKAPCLADVRSIASRQTLFGCVTRADSNRRPR